MNWCIPLLVFTGGAVIGSFLNVAALRWIQRRPYTGRSNCPHCQQTLRAKHLIPIISFMYLRARCANCQGPISVQYPLIELTAGLIALILFAPLPVLPREIIVAGLTAAISYTLLVLAVIDARTLLLPDRHIVILTLFVLVHLVLQPTHSFPSVLGGALLGSGLLLLLWGATKGRGLGFGDVKLMLPLGALLGASGVIVALWLAFTIGGLIGVWLLLRRAATLKTALPFGPMLITATIVLLLIPQLAPDLLRWWLVIY